MLVNDTRMYPAKINWASLVRDMLFSLGLAYAWIHQGVGDTGIFLSLVKQRLNDNFLQNWNGRLQTSSRASFYNNIAFFSFKPYLNDITIAKFRVSMTQLRTSSHRLEVEAGRWTKPHKKPGKIAYVHFVYF